MNSITNLINFISNLSNTRVIDDIKAKYAGLKNLSRVLLFLDSPPKA